MTIRVGVIGAGNIGTAHAHNLATAVPGSTVTAIYDVDQPAATALASERASSDAGRQRRSRT